ncbi:hypothetical protein J437_LFUL014434, partial [Ladona fulva]
NGKGEVGCVENKRIEVDWNGKIYNGTQCILVDMKTIRRMVWPSYLVTKITAIRIQGQLLNITIIQIYAPTTDAEEEEVEDFYGNLQDMVNMTPKKDVIFIIGQVKDGEALFSLSKPDLELIVDLFIAKIRLKLKRVRKTEAPIKEERQPEELWTETREIVQKGDEKHIPKTKKSRKAKWLSDEAIEVAKERKEEKSKGNRTRMSLLNKRFQRLARRDKNIYLNEQCKEIEENNRLEKTRDL